MKKIHICGPYGSGKSTLARRMSKILNVPCYSLDDIKYEIKYSKVREVSKRINAVKLICRNKEWITEGSWSDYAKEAFKNADLVILLMAPMRFSFYRILKRYWFRNKEKNDNFVGTIKLMHETYQYHTKKRPVSLFAHKSLIRKYNKKFIILSNNKDIASFLNKLCEQPLNKRIGLNYHETNPPSC